jgi:hypothetical protein
MSKVYRDAQDDARAILSCFGVLAVMVMDAEGLAAHGMMMSSVTDEAGKRHGTETLADAARILKATRERLDKLMEEFGDYFNNHDACSATQMALSTPVYEVLEKRRNGVTLDD